jgi:hypothetical protein
MPLMLDKATSPTVSNDLPALALYEGQLDDPRHGPTISKARQRPNAGKPGSWRPKQSATSIAVAHIRSRLHR